MKKTIILTFLIGISISLKSVAQDVHFSQFQNTPLLQNASYAGKSGGDIRAIVNYRSQWGSVTSNPFQTFGASIDMRFKNNANDNFLAGGLSMYSGVAGASKMRTTLVNLAAAYHIKINNESYFSGGLQVGFNQKSIDETDLRFDNQFDGTEHDPGISSNENLTTLSELKPTVSAGISYMWSDGFGRTATQSNQGTKKINIGLAVHHFNSPRFYFSSQDQLGLKYIGNFNGSFGIPSSKWAIQPLAFMALQNKAIDAVFGSLFKYTITEGSRLTNFKKSAAIGFGGYYRVGDAVIPTIQLQWSSFDLGVSYDINLSQLSGASNGRGGFEISLKYISQKSIFGRRSRVRHF